MLDPSDTTFGGCGCLMCQRAASRDTLRQVDAARASASRVPTVADPWHGPDQLSLVKGIANAVLLGGVFWLVVAVVAAIAWAWAS